MGHRGDLSDEEYNALQWCAEQLRPWRKGPWNLFGLEIDAEWRSDQKWDRLMPNLPSMEGKVLCDLGCGNGYFMLRMLEHNPKLVVGIDPNMHAWLEFQMFSYLHKTIEERVKFEILRGENIDLFENTFDVVFCLGVLYHTPDPIGVLRNIKKSMKRKGSIIVDCQGVEGEEPYALFPKRKYANMKGVYFLPTITTVQYWLSRSGFLNASVFFAEELSTNEQRATDWAPISSLEQALQKDDDIVKTVEGYPRPWRFYLKADV
jgi:tRNA (mo5U34)-methyltransferase